MKRDQIVFYVTTGLFTALILLGAGMYFFNHPEVAKAFTKLGYPTHIIYPLAVAKLLGLVAIWTKISPTLKEWAYAGFFFDLVLAIGAHVAVQDNEYAGASIGLVLLVLSYFSARRIESNQTTTHA